VIDRIESDPEAFLATLGEVFATFGPRTQDSGNVSYGVRVADQRYFVKTAGRIDDLGRAAFVALGEPDGFRGSPAQLAVAMRACEPDPAGRFDTVAALRSAWLDAPR
jgi:hypothetical protein